MLNARRIVLDEALLERPSRPGPRPGRGVAVTGLLEVRRAGRRCRDHRRPDPRAAGRRRRRGPVDRRRPGRRPHLRGDPRPPHLPLGLLRGRHRRARSLARPAGRSRLPRQHHRRRPLPGRGGRADRAPRRGEGRTRPGLPPMGSRPGPSCASGSPARPGSGRSARWGAGPGSSAEAAGPGWALRRGRRPLQGPHALGRASPTPCAKPRRWPRRYPASWGEDAALDAALRDWWAWRDRDAWEMYWLAQDMGPTDSAPILARELQLRLADDPELTQPLRARPQPRDSRLEADPAEACAADDRRGARTPARAEAGRAERGAQPRRQRIPPPAPTPGTRAEIASRA